MRGQSAGSWVGTSWPLLRGGGQLAHAQSATRRGVTAAGSPSATTTQRAYYKISFIDKIVQTFKKTTAYHNKGATGNNIRDTLGHRDQSADVTSQPLPQAHLPTQPHPRAMPWSHTEEQIEGFSLVPSILSSPENALSTPSNLARSISVPSVPCALAPTPAKIPLA